MPKHWLDKAINIGTFSKTRRRCCSSSWRRRAAAEGAAEAGLVQAVAEAGVPRGREQAGAEERAAAEVCGKPASLLAEAVVREAVEGLAVAVDLAAAVGLAPEVLAEVGAVRVLEAV